MRGASRIPRAGAPHRRSHLAQRERVAGRPCAALTIIHAGNLCGVPARNVAIEVRRQVKHCGGQHECGIGTQFVHMCRREAWHGFLWGALAGLTLAHILHLCCVPVADRRVELHWAESAGSHCREHCGHVAEQDWSACIERWVAEARAQCGCNRMYCADLSCTLLHRTCPCASTGWGAHSISLCSRCLCPIHQCAR